MAKTQLQLRSTQNKKNKSASSLIKSAYNINGLAGVFKGMQLQLLKSVLSQALLFMLKDSIDKHVLLLFLIISKNIY